MQYLQCPLFNKYPDIVHRLSIGATGDPILRLPADTKTIHKFNELKKLQDTTGDSPIDYTQWILGF